MILLEYKGEIFRPDVMFYPDGTPKVTLPEIDIKGNSAINIIWLYHSESELFILYGISENLREQGFSSVNLYMPYLPNARMDRVHEKSEVFTLKYFCKIINFMEFDRVKIFDVHSSVGEELIKRCENILPKEYINSAVGLSGIDREKDYVFFADEGSFRRYRRFFQDFKSTGYGVKNRDWKTGKILGLDIQGDSPKNKNVLIVDDICSYGGTAYHSALKLKELGCNDIYLYFTHCENSIAKGELLKGGLIKHIYTTNSLFSLENHEKITALDCTGGLL